MTQKKDGFDLNPTPETNPQKFQLLGNQKLALIVSYLKH